METAAQAASGWLDAATARGRRIALPAILAQLASVALATAQAWMVASVLGAALAGRAGGVVVAVVVFALCGVARAVLFEVAEHAALRAGAAGRHGLRAQILARLLAVGPASLRDRHSGELAALAVDQVEQLDGLFARYIPAQVVAMGGPAVVLVAACVGDPFAAVVLAIAWFAVMAAMAASGIGAAGATRAQFAALARLQTRFLDRVRGIATIVLAGRAEDEARALATAAAELRVRTMRVLRVAFLSSVALDCAMAACLVVLALHAAGRLVAGGAGNPTRALFGLLLVAEFFAPLRAFAAVYQDKMAARAASAELATLPEPVAASAAALPPPRAIEAHGVTVAFDDVSLTWDAARGPALEHISFRVAGGETLIVAGPSGAGKSSLIELLLGFAQPSAGSITLNGMRIETIVPAALAGMTAWIGQKPLLFGGTIADNIRFAKPDASDAEIAEAAGRARLAAVTDALPAGLETQIGEGGFSLSGGQAQRVAIARAFLRDAPLLLLDEPTAHLDPATEAEVLESLKRLAIGRTVILATHSVAAKALPGRRIDLRGGRLLGSANRGAA